MGTSYGSSLVKDNLVLHLDAANPKSYPGTGTVVYDLSTYNNISSTALFTHTNNSFLFNGDGQFIQFNNIIDFAIPNELTVTAWAKSSNSTWNVNGWIVSKRNQFVLHPSGGSTTINAYINDGGWKPINITPSSITIFNEYTFTYKPGYGIKAYINGEYKGVAYTTAGNLNSDTGNLTIGRDDGYTDRDGNGEISVIRLYDKALTATEIKQNYNATKGRFGL